MNQVNLIGRVVRDVAIRKTSSGKSYAFLTVAVGYWDRKEKREKADFIPVTLWGKEAERCGNLVKGSLIRVSGRITTSRFEKDGEMQYRMEVVGEDVDFLSKPRAALEGSVS